MAAAPDSSCVPPDELWIEADMIEDEAIFTGLKCYVDHPVASWVVSPSVGHAGVHQLAISIVTQVTIVIASLRSSLLVGISRKKG